MTDASLPSVSSYQEFLDRYARNGRFGCRGPIKFIQEVLLKGLLVPVDPNDPDGPKCPAYMDKWQVRFVLMYGAGKRQIAVRSGHGPGKTACLAWIITHHAITEFPQKTAITAPTTKQMFHALWPEISKWFKKCPSYIVELFEFKADMIEHRGNPDECFISAATARPESPEALAGVHCDDGSVLLVADEASGVHEKVFESAGGSMSGSRVQTLLCGNPVRTAGLFHDAHTKLKGFWNTLHVNGEKCLRVSKKYIEEMARRYGRDSNQYRVRVQGEFPRADTDTVIPFELVESAGQRDVIPSASIIPMLWGVDPARFGDDRTTLVKRRGNTVAKPGIGILAWRGLDTMQVASMIKLEWDGTPVAERPQEILVDVIGIGAGVVDRLRMFELPVRGINVSESAAMSDQYANLKAELWYKAKAWLQGLDVSIPEDVPNTLDGTLGAELALPRFKFSANGRTMVESKKEIKARGFDSPDLADGLIMTFASAAATAIMGSKNMPGQGQALKRNIKGTV